MCAQRLPPWIRIRLSCGAKSGEVRSALAEGKLNTVCESARCPNQCECFAAGTATVMILGNVCTRNCRFCAISSGAPAAPDAEEPGRVAELAEKLGLSHVVVTSVTRDDLPDGGAGHFVETIGLLRKRPGATVEVLTPDFKGCARALDRVLDAAPDVFNHNLETVKRLQAGIRPQASYEQSLGVLRAAAGRDSGPLVKSGLMVGLGETDEELREAIEDLYEAGCRLLTIGQYLAPSRGHIPVQRFVPPAVFDEYREWALAMGFAAVVSGPLVRSSYHAGEMIPGKRGTRL